MSLAKFSNEVLSRGPESVLPQNLSQEWLNAIQELTDAFLEKNFGRGTCPIKLDGVDPVLLACVTEILKSQHGGTPDISDNEMVEKIAIYALSVTMETINRETGKPAEPPSLDDIFSMERIAKLKGLYPDLEEFLDAVCISAPR